MATDEERKEDLGPQSAAADPPPMDVARRRAQSVVTIPISNGESLIARRCDLSAMLLEGTIPMPLVTAVQKMLMMPNASPEERVQSLQDEGADQILELFRKHAVKAVIQPIVTMNDDGDPTHLPVGLLSLSELTAIWKETAVLPQITAATAAIFRGRAGVVPRVPRPAVAAVPAPAESVVPQVERSGQ